ncbi:hypothetical protein [Nocardioides rubriscoriae]|uniref:hypothetical protein n=1 Tax=Nocardioides rubriscoriae TaxID=642762 RepID=UPI001B874EFC|nr:hypothetical protein [Nocardioides rubriscoriae]
MGRRRGLLADALVLLTVVLGGVGVGAVTGPATAAAAAVPVAGVAAQPTQPTQPVRRTPPAPDLGSHVTVFDPSMPTAQIQAKADAIWAAQVDDEMGSNRYALLFAPGTYGTDAQPLQIKVGYYTEVAGLGASPGDVTINGKVEVRNRCFDDDPEFTGCFALNNFWRGLSNLTIKVNGAGQDGCSASANFWAVSQAVSMRRVDVTGGNLSLMDYCTSPSFASGGFMADSRAGLVINGSQQQWYARNSDVGVWTNAVWNQVFSGMSFADPGAAPQDADYPDPPYTVLEKTPLSREKPYLFVDARGAWQVRVPSARTNTSGVSWANGTTPGRTIALRDFFVARPGDSVREINTQLARGKNLLLTPGLYDTARSIEVKRAGTVVLGIGLPTLTAVGGATPMTIADKPGIVVAGVTIDAGRVESPALLRVGKRNHDRRGSRHAPGRSNDPITLSDVYFRVGGPHVGKVDVALVVNSDDVLIDHTWVWRADHGVEGFPTVPTDVADSDFGDTARWATNTGRNGLVVNGDDVTATGLFVEHFQEYNTIWNGENGRVLLYQNELPYDPPTQADWTQPDGTLGWAGYKVADDVEVHHLWGGGVYVFNRLDPTVVTENGFEVPDAPGVVLTHVMTKNLSGPGTINHVVNGAGDAVDGILPCATPPDDPANCGPDKAQFEPPSYVISYRDGVAVLP